MNFKSYQLRDLQNTQHLLAQFEADGVSDSRFIRQRLHDHIASIMVEKEKEYRRAVPRQKRQEQRTARAQKPITICAVCGAPAVIEPINISPATVVGDGLRMAISCLNPECRHAEYSTHSVLEIIGGER